MKLSEVVDFIDRARITKTVAGLRLIGDIEGRHSPL